SDAHATTRSPSLLHNVRHIRGTAYSGPNKGAEVLPSLKTKLISLLSAAVFMCLGADCASAVNAESGIASATSARPNAQAKPATLAQEEVEHGPTQKPVEIARPFGFPITNSMVVSWIVALALVVFAQLATRRMAQVPGGAQNLLEWLVESVYNLLESVIGEHLAKKPFWFFGTSFIF